jgi:hypothetical protein
MSRHERYGTRDLTYSRWHRYALDDDITMIDIDALEYCRRCRMGLALIETARDVGQAVKPVTVLKRHAQAANVLALVILYTPSAEPCACNGNGRIAGCRHGIDVMRVRQIYPKERRLWTSMQPAEFAGWLHTLHLNHRRSVCESWGAA